MANTYGRGGWRCRLPSDNLTEKQRKEKNGKMITIFLNRAMKWNEFRGLPKSMQELFLRTMREDYGARLSDLEEMMGIDKTTICKYVTANDLKVSFTRAGRAKGMDERWAKFKANGYTAPGKIVTDDKPPLIPAMEAKATVEEKKAEPAVDKAAKPLENFNLVLDADADTVVEMIVKVCEKMKGATGDYALDMSLRKIFKA